MKFVFISLLMASLAACGTEKPSPAAITPDNEMLRLVQSIPLTNVEGRIDHLSIDLKGQRLFVAALGNNTVEVIDLAAGHTIHSISGLSEPQGIVFIPKSNELFVANGGDGSCNFYDGTTYALINRLQLGGDADNVRYDVNSRLIYVGYGDGGLISIDSLTDKVLTSIQLDGHPESFQLEPSGSRIFVNVPPANQIAVIDTQNQKVIATWLVTDAAANYPMALDASQHRLFVGFRLPSKIGVYDTEKGKSVASFDSVGDVDDIFYDADRGMVITIGGQGYVQIVSQLDGDHYKLLARVPTAPGARTGLWVPELNRLYVAEPHQGSQQAEIQAYELQP